MEAFNNEPNKEIETGPDREEKIRRAEEKVSLVFNKEMSLDSIMKRLGDEPYFKYIEQTNG